MADKPVDAKEEPASKSKTRHQQHAKKLEERLVIGAIHIRLEDGGKRVLQTDQEFFWRITERTTNEGAPLQDGFPELGRVAVVPTKYGWRPVVVVQEQRVTGEAAIKAADDLKRVRRFTANDVHTYHLVRPFKQFLKDHNIALPETSQEATK